ncbi:hypothetical protein SDJN03_02726, partial [Cucurbita argyrosperma subsp. sororia]
MMNWCSVHNRWEVSYAVDLPVEEHGSKISSHPVCFSSSRDINNSVCHYSDLHVNPEESDNSAADLMQQDVIVLVNNLQLLVLMNLK